MQNSNARSATQQNTVRDSANSKAEGKIQVRVFSLKNGLQVYDKALMIHVRSKKNSLLIMEDYLPIIGMVDGSIVISWADDEMTLSGIKGFYCHEHNSFFLLLKESSNVG
jgi:hypothetical protein